MDRQKNHTYPKRQFRSQGGVLGLTNPPPNGLGEKKGRNPAFCICHKNNSININKTPHDKFLATPLLNDSQSQLRGRAVLSVLGALGTNPNLKRKLIFASISQT